MSKLDHKKVLFRYKFIFVLLTAIAIAVVVKAGWIMTVEGDYWQKVGNRVKRDSVPEMPTRGNIVSCNGQLLASSLPEYRLFVDFQAMENSRADTLWATMEDSICKGLHEIFPTRSVAEFRNLLRDGRETKSRRCAIWPKRVNYNTYMEVKELPIFSLGRYKSGFYTEEYNARRRPYGSAAARTIGGLYGAKDTAYCGLELSFDSLLRGKEGLVKRRRVLNKYLSIIDVPVEDGVDLVTTIDVDMQDIAERALLEELQMPNVNAEAGVAILMEVATGDIKAIVNMAKCEDGEYREVINTAINYRCEPGSVFKTASILVALDDGVCDTSQVIHTGNGVMEMHSRLMKDHNYNRGGYGDINVARALEVSSNVGVSWIIDHYYAKQPQKYLDGLARVGIGEDLQLPLVGYNPPTISPFKLNAKGEPEDKTRLPWMSIGYNTQIPPINTITFYNAIANNGRMVRPRFVTAAVKDGITLVEYPTEVVKEQIAKPSTIKTMQTILRHVVSQGLGKQAGSHNFSVSGKTGTAQVSQGSKGYKSGTTGYWLSFVGFFPSEAPKYTCLVCIKKWGLPASGGGMCGPVFRQIAEGVMAKTLVCDVQDLAKTDEPQSPVKKREVKDAADCDEQHVPDVTGMGARSAVYLLESRGLRVKVKGRGTVRSQSIAPGETIRKDELCVLNLSV